MSLIKIPTHPLLQPVNRANSLKSTGPRTQSGKAQSSRIATKFGIFAKIQPGSMKALGEDPDAFQDLRQALHDAFSPEDGFEEMLVADMAEIRWRRLRLVRAESAILASQRSEWSIQRAWKKAAEEMPSPTMGVTSLGPSAENIAHILGYLETIENRVSSEGFEDETASMLETVYGTKPGHAGGCLRGSV